MDKKYRIFLERVKLITDKYKEKKSFNNFNIFTSLFNGDEEVTLHSKFIYELLRNTENSETYLSSFLEMLSEDIEMKKCEIYKEYRNIDLLIKTRDKAIIIENKIYAEDQPKQLYRYYETMKEEGIKAENISCYYLTLDGKEPSKDSLNGLKIDIDVKLISYENDIKKWIHTCIKESVYIPSLREILMQYKNLILDLTGQCDGGKLEMELKTLILENKETFGNTINLLNALTEAKIEIQKYFWNDFIEELSNLKYYIDKSMPTHVTLEKIRNYYTTNSNNKWYGIFSEIKELDENHKIYLKVEIESNVYWGLMIINKDNQVVKNHPKFQEIRDEFYKCCKEYGLSKYSDNKTEWLGFIKFNKINGDINSLNFKIFNSENLIGFVDENYRKETIKTYASEIDRVIKKLKLSI